MKESAALHRLIHSLTKNEKRYFNLFASTHRDSSDYLRIFKAIDEQEFYNENLLKELLNRSGTIEHFPVKKNQLYQLLLRAMRVYHEGRTFDATLKEMMLNASILSDKALYPDSYVILNRAMELSKHFEEWKVQLEILHRRYTILFHLSGLHEAEKEASLIEKEEEDILAQLNNYGLLGKLNIRLTLLLKKGVANKKEIEKLLRHPVLRSEKNALSFRSKSLYFLMWSSYLIYKNQYAKASQFLRKHIALYEKLPQFIEASPGNYLSVLKDLLEVNFRLKRFKEATKLIQQLKQLPEDSRVRKIGSRRFRQLIFSWTFRIEVSIAIQTEEIQKVKPYVREQEEYFARIEHGIETEKRLETHLALASFHFFSGDQKKSVRHLQKIFSDEVVNRFPSIQLQAMMLHWFIHYTDLNREMMDYLFTPIERLMKKEKKLSKTQSLLFTFISALMNTVSVKERRALLKSYERKFLQLKKSDAESFLYNYFDITLWLKKGK